MKYTKHRNLRANITVTVNRKDVLLTSLTCILSLYSRDHWFVSKVLCGTCTKTWRTRSDLDLFNPLDAGMGLGGPARIFLKNLCRSYLTYGRGVPGILLQLMLDCFRGLIQKKKTFEVGGAPVSLDYAKFLGCHFRLDFQFFLLCLDRFTILGRYFSEYVSFATCFYHFFHSLKISTASSGHLLRLARGLCLGCERRKTFD